MPQDLRPAIIGVNTTFIFLTLAAIGCRVARKFRMLSSFSWHDGKFTVDMPWLTMWLY